MRMKCVDSLKIFLILSLKRDKNGPPAGFFGLEEAEVPNEVSACSNPD
jgi:hypothetical protein